LGAFGITGPEDLADLRAPIMKYMGQMNQSEADLDTFRVGNLALPRINAFEGSGFDQAQSQLSYLNTYFSDPRNRSAYDSLSDDQKAQVNTFMGTSLSMYQQRGTVQEGGQLVYKGMTPAQQYAPNVWNIFSNAASKNPNNSIPGPNGQSVSPNQETGDVKVGEQPTPIPSLTGRFGEAVSAIENKDEDLNYQMFGTYFPDQVAELTAGNVASSLPDPGSRLIQVQKLFEDRGRQYSAKANTMAIDILKSDAGKDIATGVSIGRGSGLETFFRDNVDPQDPTSVGAFIDALSIIQPTVSESRLPPISDIETTPGVLGGRNIQIGGSIKPDRKTTDQFIVDTLAEMPIWKNSDTAIPKSISEFNQRKTDMDASVNSYRNLIDLLRAGGMNNLERKVSELSDSARNIINTFSSKSLGLLSAKNDKGEFLISNEDRGDVNSLISEFQSGEATLSRVLSFYVYEAAYLRAKALEGPGARLSQQDFERALDNVRGSLFESEEVTDIRFQLLAGDTFVDAGIFDRVGGALRGVRGALNIKRDIPKLKAFVRTVDSVSTFKNGVTNPISVARDLFRPKSDGTNLIDTSEYAIPEAYFLGLLEYAQSEFGPDASVDNTIFRPAMIRGSTMLPIPNFDVFFVKVETPKGTKFLKIPKQDLAKAENQQPRATTPTPSETSPEGSAPAGEETFIPSGINPATNEPYGSPPPGYKYVDQGNGIFTLRVK